LIASTILALGTGAHAVITVESTFDQVGSTIRTQGVIKNPTGFQDGSTQTAVAIKEINASILIRDVEFANGLSVTKRQLTPQQTYGAGLPMGYQQPPFSDPEGPWFGLVWPYRDHYDYFRGPNDPLGDDVGIVFHDQPGVYGIVDIEAFERGGPTDDVPPPGQTNPEWLNRGLTGNGLEGPATYFLFDIIPTEGPGDRLVRLRIFGASAIVVQRDTQTGQYSEIRVPIADFETLVRLPEPATAMLGAIGACALALRPRRRRS
jgi:hypothetical protein